MHITVNDSTELRALKSRRGRRGVRRVSLRLPGYPGDLRRAEYHINRNLRPRSLRWIATFAVAGLLLAALAFGFFPSWLPRRTILAVMGGVLGVGIVSGWIFAHALARWRLVRTIDWISARTAAFERPASELSRTRPSKDDPPSQPPPAPPARTANPPRAAEQPPLPPPTEPTVRRFKATLPPSDADESTVVAAVRAYGREPRSGNR
ncbi:MAG TPA: hypothetical protein VFR86_27265 [Burkholderiaceae bacterium]|nr:hypothetical protein [Burkholderiaceae bacterium]